MPSALLIRASAALEAIRDGADPAVALSYAVWPTDEVLAASTAPARPRPSAEQRARAVELVDGGASWAAAAAAVGAHKQTVGGWVRAARKSTAAAA